eukprot:tig00020553_g10602.t1
MPGLPIIELGDPIPKLVAHKEFEPDSVEDGQLTPRERHGLHGQLQIQLFSGKGFEGTNNAVVLFSVGEEQAETPYTRRDPHTGLFSFNQEHAFEIEPFSYPKIFIKVYDSDRRKRIGAIKMGYVRMAARSPPESELWVSVATPASRRREAGDSAGPVSGDLHVRVRFLHSPDSEGFVASSPQFATPPPGSPALSQLRSRRPAGGRPPGRGPLLSTPSKEWGSPAAPTTRSFTDRRASASASNGGGWLARIGLKCIPDSWSCWEDQCVFWEKRRAGGEYANPTPLPAITVSPTGTPRSVSLGSAPSFSSLPR